MNFYFALFGEECSLEELNKSDRISQIGLIIFLVLLTLSVFFFWRIRRSKLKGRSRTLAYLSWVAFTVFITIGIPLAYQLANPLWCTPP